MHPINVFIVGCYATITIFQISQASEGVPQYLLQYVADQDCTSGNHTIGLNPTSDKEQDLIPPRNGEDVYFKVMGL